MDSELIGYLLNALEPDACEAVERQLEESAEVRQRLPVLRRLLDTLECDRETSVPPPELVVQTLRKVATQRSLEKRGVARVGRAAAAVNLPRVSEAANPWHAPALSPPASRPVSRSRWRRTDVAVAASIIFVALLMIPPALLSVRNLSYRTACADNLREFARAFTLYENDRGHLPQPPKDKDSVLAVAGIYGPELRQAGYWNVSGMGIFCPANGRGRRQGVPPTPDELVEAAKCQTCNTMELCKRMGGCYGYHIGYRDQETGEVLPLRRANLIGDIPLLADRPLRLGEPNFADPEANSPNHGGAGQNVLYYPGGHVRYERRRIVNGDDIYRNRDGRLAPGHSPTDAVLAPSEVSPYRE